MSCTKLLAKARYRERIFRIFENNKPYVLTLVYRRLFPKTEGGSGLGIGMGPFHFTDVQEAIYVKERHYNMTKDECDETIQKLKDGFCYKCGNVKNCTKIEFPRFIELRK